MQKMLNNKPQESHELEQRMMRVAQENQQYREMYEESLTSQSNTGSEIDRYRRERSLTSSRSTTETCDEAQIEAQLT